MPKRWAAAGLLRDARITMAIEVLRREVFSYSSIWGEEIVRYSFIYLAWIGAAAAVKERGHIRIDVIMHYLGPRAKALLYIFGDIVMFVVAVIALYWSWEAVHVSAKFGSVTHGLRVCQVWFLCRRADRLCADDLPAGPVLPARSQRPSERQARLRRRQAVRLRGRGHALESTSGSNRRSSAGISTCPVLLFVLLIALGGAGLGRDRRRPRS